MIESKRNIVSHRSRAHELSERNRRYELDSKLDTENGDGEGSSSSKRDTRARSAAEFGMGGDDELQTKTNEVTTALRRTTALMQTELERSVLSVQMLDSSTQTLLSTTTLYDNYTSLLAKSGQLVKIIEKADTIDRLIIFAALLFFLLVVAFIVKRRVIDRTLGVVVGGVGRGVGWYLFGTGKLVRLAFGGGGGGRGRGAGGRGTGGREMAGLAQEGVGVGSAQLDQSGTNCHPNIGSDSAITPQTEQQAQAQAQAERKQGQYEQDTIIGVDLGPGHIPHKDYTYDARNNVRGSGEVEVIADDVADRIRPTWVEQVDERAQGRNRDEL
ncbi:hypothetical protein I316_00105 [Kwoniella heveanensis BCC8398]|uniref:Sec20 C-terminal domain-containing protein n=1 Tax=Kwoniella heveanensis BCC8398 TaxID=1296120 RepID=A0A1B9H3M8_9TREE|nr:hypothetical protein I316_00105 [Kwoniella heveanensis BCC8398]